MRFAGCYINYDETIFVSIIIFLSLHSLHSKMKGPSCIVLYLVVRPRSVPLCNYWGTDVAETEFFLFSQVIFKVFSNTLAFKRVLDATHAVSGRDELD